MKSTEKRHHFAVYGPRHGDWFDDESLLSLAIQLGKEIAGRQGILGIPLVPGFSQWVAKGVKKGDGSCVLGFSPAANEEEHRTRYGLPLKFVDTVIYTGFGSTGAELLLSRSSDVVIFVHAGIDLYHAFLVAREQGKEIRFFSDPSLGKDELLTYLREKGELKDEGVLVTNILSQLLKN